MKINKNIIKELNDYLDEFNLTEIEYTEKDVKITTNNEIISGKGFYASPDFTKYEITNINGTFDIIDELE